MGMKENCILDVDYDTKMKLLLKKDKEEKKYARIIESMDNKPLNLNGRNISIYGNISNVDGAEDVLKFGGDGIGLLRSEFVFMNHDNYPTEEEQFFSV
jgi:phosphotransferase system enzyme I (PtsI)